MKVTDEVVDVLIDDRRHLLLLNLRAPALGQQDDDVHALKTL